MVFESLPLDLQNIYMTEFFQIAKFFIFISTLAFCIFYIFFLQKNEKKTIYIHVSVLRALLWVFSWSFFLLSPFFIIALTPVLSFWSFYIIYFAIYGIFLAIYIFSISLDLWRYAIPVLLQIGGLDMKDPAVKEILRTHFKKEFK